MANAVLKCGQIARQFQSPRGPHGVPDETFALLKNVSLWPNTSRRASHSRISPLGVPVACVLTISICSAASPADGVPFACTRLGARIRQNKIGRVRVHRVAGDFAINLAPRTLASDNRSRTYRQPPSATTMPLRFVSKGREAFVGSACVARAPWLAKPAKMPNVWMLSGNTARKRDVAFAQPQHLQALINPAFPPRKPHRSCSVAR